MFMVWLCSILNHQIDANMWFQSAVFSRNSVHLRKGSFTPELIRKNLIKSPRSWISTFFPQETLPFAFRYTPCDLNMPKTVPKRKDDWKTANDTPLTVIGFSELISVEPGLHEWMQWTRYHRPTFMEPVELHENGYPIDTDYKPIIELRDLSSTETLEEFYDRGYSVVKQLLERHSSGAILLAAHGDMPDCCTRKLCGGEPRPFDDFFALVKRTPFLGCVQAVEEQDGSWKIGPSPIPPLTHMDNGTYDSQQLCRPVPPMDEEMRNDIPPWMRNQCSSCSLGFSELISVEPGLHEWMQCTSARYHRPTYMEPVELHENGFPIDTDYKPIIELRELSSTETLEEFYDRGYSVVKQLLERHSSGAILLAAHGDMPDCCTRKLCGGEPRPFDDFFALVKRTPFLGCVQAVEEQDGSWRIGPSPIPPLTHMDNGTYDSQQLCRPVPPMDEEMRNDIPPWMRKKAHKVLLPRTLPFADLKPNVSQKYHRRETRRAMRFCLQYPRFIMDLEGVRLGGKVPTLRSEHATNLAKTKGRLENG
ncbi:unnamed protein product [Nippostrongylus brasiliensis]|uniref:Sulfatase domain-containing protein n=1 Tax=Nippostrongylus brasiliensis TaxID=27835 RepID=A0A158QYF5_NIPBR|nr:unnamed protein product [Nippostrongylus brasiliensis]